jgi:sulfide:quinone oxidoreductase
MFQWMYWHVLLPGRDIPGISPQMQMTGKKQPASTTV